MGEMQQRVVDVGAQAFGAESMYEARERANRFAEEAAELLQASGMPLERLIELATYVYGRPKGNLKQEFGGVGVTLYAFANAHWIDLDHVVETEITRVEQNIGKIRAKAAKKPDFLFHTRPIAPEAAQ
jgi:hypothetical protein